MLPVNYSWGFFEDVIQMQLCILARLKQAPLISDTANLFHLKISCQHLILLIVMHAILLSTVKLALLHPSGSPFWHSLCRKVWIWLWLSLDLHRFQMMQFRLSCVHWTHTEPPGCDWLSPRTYMPVLEHLADSQKTPSMVWDCVFTGAFRSIKDQQREKYSIPLHHHHHHESLRGAERRWKRASLYNKAVSWLSEPVAYHSDQYV